VKKESQKQLKSRATKIIRILRNTYPTKKTALHFSSPLELLISTILSAQCTDKRVNIVTKDLFKKYRSVNDFANARQSELEQDIRTTGFYRNKAKNIIACGRMLEEKFGGIVPRTMENLLQLPGVGRKTANCVLGGAFGLNEGVVVDTHVQRLSQRLGLTTYEDPVRIEEDLMHLVPRNVWYDFSNMIILHGRAVCNARKPNCPECPVRDNCPSAENFLLRFWRG
jgi:endonuclease-3